MSASCAFCDRGLGKNELLPEQPIGKKLAFDPLNARLWVVCTSCGRWNLAALDETERRAAVARLEQFYMATPTRGAVEGIGLAELAGGTSLVRIGNATWSQFAAWRYSHRLTTRRRRWVVFMLFGLAANVFLWSPEGDALMSTTLGLGAVLAVITLFALSSDRRVVARLSSDDGKRPIIRARHLMHAELDIHASGWRLLVPHTKGAAALEGRDAIRALALIMPQLNPKGANELQLTRAIELIETAGGPEHLFATRLTPAWMGEGRHKLHQLPIDFFLALEMAAHEETERRALRGELTALTMEWKEAAETAKVAEELAW